MIRVAIEAPDAYVERAQYVFGVFALHWGIPVRQVGAEVDADIRYGREHRPHDSGILNIPFDERLYDPSYTPRPLQHEGRQFWSAMDRDAPSTDVVASSYRLLTFLDERQVDPKARDRRGIFLTHALPPSRRRVVQVPLVDDHAAFLLERLRRSRPDLIESAIPKWPAGKKYAVALTHDTDAVTLGAPRELLTNTAKLITRRKRVYADKIRAGIKHFGDPTGNPLFGFPRWRELEFDWRLRSSFYLYARVVRLKADVNNCKSSVVEQNIDWSLLRNMAADGWEFGLHAPINAKNNIAAFADGKRWIEDRLDAPIFGLRHHYWALDWLAPFKTWRMHQRSGFRYDVSMAWRDVGGFRAATCHPFQPFDPERNQRLDIYQVPSCLMDGHIVGQHGDVETDAADGLETIYQAKRRGGAAVLDWHTESACNAFDYEHTVTTLMHIVDTLLNDGDAWFTTPWQIVQHWQQRQALLDAR